MKLFAPVYWNAKANVQIVQELLGLRLHWIIMTGVNLLVCPDATFTLVLALQHGRSPTGKSTHATPDRRHMCILIKSQFVILLAFAFAGLVLTCLRV